MRWAAQSAAAGGYRVISMDLFGDLDTRAACVHSETISPAEQADPNLLNVAIARIAHQERAAVVWVSGLRSASYGGNESAQLSHERLAELAQKAGFRSPESVSFELGGKRVSTAARWLVKEQNSAGGLGVRFHDPCRNRSIPAGALLQSWIAGRPLGLVAIADGRRVSLLGMTRSIYHRCGNLPFIYAGSRTLAHTDAIPWSSMHTICERIADARGLRGLFNLDWIRDRQNQWWLLEINERPSASCEVIERASRANGIRPQNASLMRQHLAAILPAHVSLARMSPSEADSDDRPSNLNDVQHSAENRRRAPTMHIKRIVYSRCDGRVQLSELPLSWRTGKIESVDVGASSGLQLADIPADGTPVQQGQPIATLLLDSVPGETLSARKLHRAIRQLQMAVR